MWSRGFVPLLLRPLVLRNSYAVLPVDIRIHQAAWERLPPNLMSEFDDLLQDHLPHLGHIFYYLKTKVECGVAVGLIARVMPDAKVPVLQRLLHRDTRARVKREHLVEEIEGIGVGIRKEPLEWNFRHEREVPNILLRSRRPNSRECLFIRRSEEVKDLIELIDVITALEKWPSSE
jgi:hypothetical protein